MQGNWIRITPVENIPPRQGRSVTLGGAELAIFNVDGRFMTIDNQCPHKGGPLCDGIVSGTTVVCPLHGWKISLETGHVLKPNVCVRVTTYPVSVEDGVVCVEIDKCKQENAA